VFNADTWAIVIERLVFQVHSCCSLLAIYMLISYKLKWHSPAQYVLWFDFYVSITTALINVVFVLWKSVQCMQLNWFFVVKSVLYLQWNCLFMKTMRCLQLNSWLCESVQFLQLNYLFCGKCTIPAIELFVLWTVHSTCSWTICFVKKCTVPANELLDF
jgi:hypothetical protein